MAIIWTGPGDVGFRTTRISGGASNQLAFPYGLFSASLAQEVSPTNAEVYRGGRRVPDTILQSSVVTTLTVSTQLNNWSTLGLGLNQIQRTESSITIPVVKRGRVASSSPFVITDAQIIAGNVASVVAAVEDPGAWGQPGPLTRVGAAPASAREYQPASGTITFHSSLAGADVTYFLNRSITTASTYGGQGSVTAIGEMEFVGEVFDSANVLTAWIHIPAITVSSTPSFEFSGDAIETEITFNCNTPAGWAAPFRYIALQGLT